MEEHFSTEAHIFAVIARRLCDEATSFYACPKPIPLNVFGHVFLGERLGTKQPLSARTLNIRLLKSSTNVFMEVFV